MQADSITRYEHLALYINEKEVSRITARALPTLRNDRHRRKGIPYVKFGRSVRYCLNDVIAYMESRKIRTEPVNHL